MEKPVTTEHESELALADRHIADAQRRIAEQEGRIMSQRASGFDSARSEELLTVMKEILINFNDHRRLIAENVDRLRRLI